MGLLLCWNILFLPFAMLNLVIKATGSSLSIKERFGEAYEAILHSDIQCNVEISFCQHKKRQAGYINTVHQCYRYDCSEHGECYYQNVLSVMPLKRNSEKYCVCDSGWWGRYCQCPKGLWGEGPNCTNPLPWCCQPETAVWSSMTIGIDPMYNCRYCANSGRCVRGLHQYHDLLSTGGIRKKPNKTLVVNLMTQNAELLMTQKAEPKCECKAPWKGKQCTEQPRLCKYKQSDGYECKHGICVDRDEDNDKVSDFYTCGCFIKHIKSHCKRVDLCLSEAIEQLHKQDRLRDLHHLCSTRVIRFNSLGINYCKANGPIITPQ